MSNGAIKTLPQELSERVRILNDAPVFDDGKYVLYWMRTALRAEENPALNVAVSASNQLQKPLLVYHGLSQRYPYASDRHHTFILQGARDVRRQLANLGISYALHLERPQHRGKHLLNLAGNAALVITEEMPVEPLRRWTSALCHDLACRVLAVDTACVVPMRLVGKSYDRAFAYRQATKRLYEEWISVEPTDVKPLVSFSSAPSLPYQPVDLENEEIADLVSQCEIDHSIGPVPHTVGGSAAGYRRWQEFKENDLTVYDRRRNNALVDGVSRMSPYLHYGMVSPMRIAREAAAENSKGAEKYLDELLIWRELAYAFCFYRSDHWRVAALPQWSIQTLSEHEFDRRESLLSWETMARGQTGDSLWDSAQRSLLIHGELHNNVRMTWGKAILRWTPNAKQALKQIIDLNHRYALDGCDPASYGGILWCLGQFDRPFLPPRPIFGTVRDRSTDQHAKRLDPKAYRRKVTRPWFQPMPKVAVIGAGLSGLVCARTLSDHGFDVTVFEKSRGVGGRMATRRVGDDLSFDHGAQYFTARDHRFKRYVRSWVHDQLVKQWQGRIVTIEEGVVKEEKRSTDRFVAVPGMNAIGKHLATDLNIHFQTQVEPLTREDEKWVVANDQAELGRFDIAIAAIPAAQAAIVLAEAPQLAAQARGTEMTGCWAVMLAFADPLNVAFDGAFVHQSPLSWVARNSSKPGREREQENWVLHATPEWTSEHIDDPQELVEKMLVDEFWNATGLSSTSPIHSASHRWRFALPPEPLAATCLFDRQLQIGACGDWCGGPRVEGAFLSGMAMAGRVMGLAKPTHRSDLDDSHQLQLF